MAPSGETNVSIDINPSFFLLCMPVEWVGFTWMGWTSSFVCSLKYGLLWKIKTEIKAFFQGTSLHVRGGAGASCMNSWTIHASLTLSAYSVLYNLFSGYSSLPGLIQQSITTHPSTPNSDPAPLLPLPSPGSGPGVFSDLGSQPAAAFPLGQLVEWFQCWACAHL